MTDYKKIFPSFFEESMDCGMTLKYPTMDWEMNEFMKRSDENDSNSVRVSMNQDGKIEFSANPEKTEVIYTFGLCGCVASSLVVELKNGRQVAIMTHEDPLRMSIGGLTELWIRKNLGDIKVEDIEKASFFVVAPGEWSKDSEGKFKHLIKSDYQNKTARFRSQIKNLMGGVAKFTEIEIQYSESQEYGKKNQGVFRIVKDKSGNLKYVAENYYPSGNVFN
jgi:hypothetical protein